MITSSSSSKRFNCRSRSHRWSGMTFIKASKSSVIRFCMFLPPMMRVFVRPVRRPAFVLRAELRTGDRGRHLPVYDRQGLDERLADAHDQALDHDDLRADGLEADARDHFLQPVLVAAHADVERF